MAARAQPAATAPAARTALKARADAVVGLLNGEVQPADIFTSSFRTEVTDAQIKALSTSLTTQFGRALGLNALYPHDGTRAALEIQLERGIAKGGIAVDLAEDSRINELRFTLVDAVALAGDTQEAIAAELAALPGSVNAWFGLLGGTPLLSCNANTPLALGSAFKLYVLAALAEDVKAGRRKWSDVVPLDQTSYPSRQLQTWPQGAPVTLHTLASLMISISDNTATDQLIKVMGRKRMLKLMADSGHSDPARNAPFLTTRELFVIKASDHKHIAGWRKSDVVQREVILAKIASEAPSLDAVNAAFANGPKALDIEWFASPADLGRLLAYLRRTADPEAFAIMAINPAAVIDERKFEGLAQRILLLPR